MQWSSIFVLAIGLAMDATAVAATRGYASSRIRPRDAIEVALCFGGLQALMPVIGWAIGSRFGEYVAAWDHFIAFGMLGALGLKMLWESRHANDVPEREEPSFRALLWLGIATSIDALAVGLTLPLLEAPLLLSIATIGVTTAVLATLGLYAGRHFGALFGKQLDVFGGLVLIGLGTKILVEHVTTGT
jgi:putative Mn2+ efflux pump MntP